MKKISYLFSLFLSSCLILLSFGSRGQVILTMDTVYCGSTTTTLHATVIGDVPLSSGIVEDDIYAPSAYPLGFTFDFYGTPYTQVLIGANGNLSFDLSLAGAYDPWPISAALLGNTSVLNCICGPWCDIYVPAYGIITYSNDGTAPNRRFIVNFCRCAMFSCTTQWITTQMVLNETTNDVDVYVAHKTFCTSWNSGAAIIGVQNAAGTDAVVAPGRDFPATYNCVDEGWKFTPISGGTTYSVTPVPFSPVPYPATMLYWYDSSTGAFIDSGSTLTVSATTSGTYTCAALGCGDTSFSYIHVSAVSLGVQLFTFGSGPGTSNSTNPTQCGTANGTITLRGHKMIPGSSDTIAFDYNGVPQPHVIATVASDSSILISGLCAGTYSDITVTQGACTSGPSGPVTLTDPTISIASVTVVNPDTCGNKGSLVLNGLYPGKSFTVSYNVGGIPATPVVLPSSGTGTVTMPDLCPAVYSNIVASFTGCDVCTTAPPKGPYTISNPGISITGLSSQNASQCGLYDGSILLSGLYSGRSYTVTYDSNGVANTVTLVASDTGTLNITGLRGDGVSYTNIIASYTTCSVCATPAAGPVVLTTPPPPPIHVLSHTDPTQCGFCDGTIILRAVAPYSSDTIGYFYNGVAGKVILYANVDSTITLSGLCSGTYSGISVKVGPCLQYVPEDVTLINPTISAGFTDVVNRGCHGDTVVFTNESSSVLAVPPVVMFYNWNFGDGTSDSSKNPYHVYAQGTYTVTLTADNHTCFTDTTMVITLSHPLTVGFTYTPVTGILCQDSPVVFTNTSTGNIVSNLWSFGNGATASTTDAKYYYKQSGVYNAMLVVTNDVPCSDTSIAVIQVDSQSNIVIDVTDSIICRGTDIHFTGIYTKSGSTGITWYFGDGDSVQNLSSVAHTYDGIGVFTVTANAYYRVCQDTSATKVIHIYPQPVINLGAADTTICAGSSPLVLTDNINIGNPAATWTWNTGQTGPRISVTEAGTYTATVNLDGCKSSYSVVVSNDCYMSIPNVFSPNNDGLNDYFFPRTTLTSGLVSFSMSIYNRWGEQMYQSTSLDGRGWDGKLNNVDQPEGVYVYIIDAEFKDGEKEHHQGNVTLLR